MFWPRLSMPIDLLGKIYILWDGDESVDCPSMQDGDSAIIHFQGSRWGFGFSHPCQLGLLGKTYTAIIAHEQNTVLSKMGSCI